MSLTATLRNKNVYWIRPNNITLKGIIIVDVLARLDSLVSSLNDSDLLYLAKLVRDRLDEQIRAEEERLEQENDARELAEYT